MYKFIIINVLLLIFQQSIYADQTDELLLGAKKGDLALVKNAYDNGGKINTYSDEYCFTPLMLAAINGHPKIVKYLVENGAWLESESGEVNSDTALVLAAANGHFEIVKYLVNMGANVNVVLSPRGGDSSEKQLP